MSTATLSSELVAETADRQEKRRRAISGAVFSEFRRVNPEIKEVSLVENGQVLIATEASKAGRALVSDSRYFEYHIPVAGDEKRQTNLVVTVPRDIVYERVLRSVKNFAALFVASAFLAVLLLQVGAALQDVARASPEKLSAAASEAGLVMIKPVFFLAVFLDSS